MASELNERKMTIEERQQFIEAKVSELNSFFENGVWEIEQGVADADRTLKARFLLKWA